MRREAHRLVFVDETGTNTKMTRLRGRCPRGRRLRAKAPFGHWKIQTFIAGLRWRGLTAPFVVDQPMNRRIFDVWVQTQLVPTLSKGDVVILDNLPAHKSHVAKDAIRAKGAWPLYLPSYSLNLNPIEMAFSKLKAHLRARERTHHRRTVARHRRHLRSLQTNRMRKLLQGRRLCSHLNVRRSSR